MLNGGRQPFFIVGTGRCGSTLLAQLLEPHPQVALTDEARLLDALWFFFQFANLPAFQEKEFQFAYPFRLHGWVGRQYTGDFAAVLRDHAAAMLEEFYARRFGHKPFTHYGDKLPGIEAAVAMAELLPKTRFVVLSRDPRDSYCSVRAWASVPGTKRINPLLEPPGLEDFAHHWRNLYGGAMQYLPDRMHLRYEDLIADRHASLARVMAFVGLPLAPEQNGTLERPELFAVHGTARDPGATVGRWRNELTEAESLSIRTICGDVMARLGYASDGEA
jgi:hypothetical protein